MKRSFRVSGRAFAQAGFALVLMLLEAEQNGFPTTLYIRFSVLDHVCAWLQQSYGGLIGWAITRALS